MRNIVRSLSACAAASAMGFGAAAAAADRPTFTPCPEVACKGADDMAALFGHEPVPPRRLRPATAVATPPPPCPLLREELGRATWAVLHTTAAYYPEHPTAEERAAAAGLVTALRHLYPCTHCRAALAVELEASPLGDHARDRTAFSLWVCRHHNAVNVALGAWVGG